MIPYETIHSQEQSDPTIVKRTKMQLRSLQVVDEVYITKLPLSFPNATDALRAFPADLVIVTTGMHHVICKAK